MMLLMKMHACLAMMTASLWRAQTTYYDRDGEKWENKPEGRGHPRCAADPMPSRMHGCIHVRSRSVSEDVSVASGATRARVAACACLAGGASATTDTAAATAPLRPRARSGTMRRSSGRRRGSLRLTRCGRIRRRVARASSSARQIDISATHLGDISRARISASISRVEYLSARHRDAVSRPSPPPRCASEHLTEFAGVYFPDSIEEFGENLVPFIPDAEDFIKGGVDFDEQADTPEISPR